LTTLSPSDLFYLQQDIQSGKRTVDQIPADAVAQLQNYWSAQGANGANPNDALVSGTSGQNLTTLQNQRSAAASASSLWFMKPLEMVGSKIYALYSNTVSPILSGAALSLHNLFYGAPAGWENRSNSDIWNAAKSVSPGQALWMLGLNNKELHDRGLDPMQLTQDAKLLKAGQYRDTPTAKDPFGTKTRKEEYFDEGPAKYVTGTADLAVSWYADPLVLTGKAAGAAKVRLATKPVERLTNPGIVARAMGAKSGTEAINTSSTVNAMVKQVMDIKIKNPDNAAYVLQNNFSTFKKSANGPTISSLMAQAKGEDQVRSVLRITMGDGAAMGTLEAQNISLGIQAKTAAAKTTALGDRFAGLSPASQASPAGVRIKAYIADQEKMIRGLDDELQFSNRQASAFGSLAELNFNRVTSPLAIRARGSEIAQGNLKAVRGAGLMAVPHLAYNASVGFPIKIARSYGDIKPSAYIDIHEPDSYRVLDGLLGETKSISRETREKHVADYIKATPDQRGRQLMEMEESVTKDLAAKYGVTVETAKDLYKDFAQRRMITQGDARNRTYSAGKMQDPSNPGSQIRFADIEADGGRIVSTPILDTQLANNHVVLDFRQMEKLIKNDGKRFDQQRKWVGDKWATGDDIAGKLNTYWKFAQLARLGYAPRALADDFLGQVARFGAVEMMSRTANGTSDLVNRVARGTWAKSTAEANRIELDILNGHIAQLTSREGALKTQMVETHLAGEPTTFHEHDYEANASDLMEAKQRHYELTQSLEKNAQKDVRVGRQIFSGAGAGQEGGMFMDLAAGERNMANMLGRQADWYLKNTRGLDWENLSVSSHGVEKHMAAWTRVINDQIGKSTVARQALMGKSENEIASWMRSTPEGREYRTNINLDHTSDAELAQRVKGHVDYILDPAHAGMDVIRKQVLEGKLDGQLLKDTVPAINRPEVNGEAFKYSEGTSLAAKAVDRFISGYYRAANQLPATKLLRNPLFKTRYKGHLGDNMKVLQSQGITHVDEATRQILEKNARVAALKDVKDFTFTMDHESKLAYHTRNFGAFFGAQQESWNRWARIIADKPQVLPHIAQVYGAPARVGMVVDQDGQAVDGAGYSTNPATGERTLVKYGNRKLLFQVPDYLGGKALNKFMGLDKDASFVIPMSSAELVLNHGDGMLPVGAGPYVQMAVNHFAKEDPNIADWAQQLGVLPFGPQDSVLDFINPNTGKRLGDSNDDMGETRQRALLYSMQVENYKWENGLRDTQPTWKELDSRAKTWSRFKAAMAFGLPLSVNQQDPYQFFRDEYSRMQKADVTNADEAFYSKYGDSFYSFSQSLSKNNTGLKPTAESVQVGKYYSDLIDKVGPEYAGLIVGDEGDGTFSNGAYYYQKTHGVVPGAGPDRSTLSARDAWTQAQVSKGWKIYGQINDKINASMLDRGLTSLDDAGGEDLKSKHVALGKLLSSPTFPDGTENAYYNEAWAKEFGTLDQTKYDRRAFDMNQIANDPELLAKSMNEDGSMGIRSEIATLKTYLFLRTQMAVALQARKNVGGSTDITANSNADLKSSFTAATNDLIERDTKFGRLHSRWFPTDMGYNKLVDAQALEGSNA
jgi:hypothetical protein